MAKPAASFSIKTPTRSISSKNAKLIMNQFMNEIENNITRVSFNQLYETAEERRIDSLLLICTFFQRVVARTPLDEKYIKHYTRLVGAAGPDGNMVTTEKEVTELHIPDNDRCKFDWIIRSRKYQFTSEELMKRGIEFRYIDNREDIQKLVSILDEYIWDDGNGNLEVEIYNINKHYTVLEFGGDYQHPENNWGENGTGVISKGPMYKHGVVNKHSVQAPIGMMRVTEAELLSGANNNITARNQFTQGHTRGMYRDFPDSELKKILEVMKKKKIKYRDIARYMRKR